MLGRKLTFLLLAVLPAVTTHGAEGQECQSLVQYTQDNPRCRSIECAGVECFNISHGFQMPQGYASLRVEKCTDPVQVEVVVEDPTIGITEYDHTFFENGGATQTDGSTLVMVTLDRNATYLQFGVSTIFEGDIAIQILPFGELSLNASDCMCQSLSAVADAIHLPTNIPFVTVSYECTRRQSCTGIHCDISVNGNYSTDALIDPCDESLHLIMYDSSGNSVYDNVFNDSKSVPLDLGSGLSGSIDVGITHKSYSMMLTIDITFSLPIGDQVINVLPEHQIILDRSNCSQPSYPTEAPETTTSRPSTTGSTTAATPPPVVTTTTAITVTTHGAEGQECQSLVQYTQDNPWCRSIECAGVECFNISHGFQMPQGYASLRVEKCTDPVQVEVVVEDPPIGITEYDHTFFENGGATQTDGSTLVMVTLDRNATYLQFSVYTIFEGDIAIQILPFGELSLNASDCMCQSLSAVADAIHLPTNIPFVTVSYECTRRQSCTGIHCDISVNGNYSTDALIDPCDESLHLIMYDSSGNSVYDNVFNDSKSVPLDLGSGLSGSIDVGITHKSYSMMLTIDITVSLPIGDQVINVLPEHQIILDRSNCSQPSYPTDAPETTTSRPSTTGTTTVATPPPVVTTTTAKTDNQLAVKVSVPIAVLVCLAVAVVVGLFVVLPLCRKLKRTRQYNFQRMSFREVSDGDNED